MQHTITYPNSGTRFTLDCHPSLTSTDFTISIGKYRVGKSGHFYKMYIDKQQAIKLQNELTMFINDMSCT